MSLAPAASIVCDAEQDQRARPVEGLGDGRCLAQLERAQRAHDAGHLVGQLLADAGHLGAHDLALAVEVRVVDVQVEAAPLERFGQLAGVVGGEEHHGQLRGPHGAELGDRHLVLGEDLEQQRLGLELDAVHLVDEQHHRFGGPDRLEQRPGQQEVLGEDVLLELRPARALRPRPCRARPPGCAAAACGSSTRRAPWTRRAPRSTAGGSDRAPVSSATDLASCVLPVPAGPSTRTGLASRSAR